MSGGDPFAGWSTFDFLRDAGVATTSRCGCGGRFVDETNRGDEHSICTSCARCLRCDGNGDEVSR